MDEVHNNNTTATKRGHKRATKRGKRLLSDRSEAGRQASRASSVHTYTQTAHPQARGSMAFPPPLHPMLLLLIMPHIMPPGGLLLLLLVAGRTRRRTYSESP